MFTFSKKRNIILFMKCNHKQMKSEIYEIIKEIYE